MNIVAMACVEGEEHEHEAYASEAPTRRRGGEEGAVAMETVAS